MSRFPLRKNYTLLALAVVYGIVAIMQLFADGIFSIRLYYSVAFISLLTTLCEFLKSSTKWIRLLEKERSDNILERQNRIKEHIAVFDKCPALFELTEAYKNSFEDMSKYLDQKPERIHVKFLKFLDIEESILPFVEIFQILFVTIITPLKIVPNNLLTNKTISILSLLSVAFAFLSIYMNEVVSNMIDQAQEKRRNLFQTSDHYLNIIKRILDTQQISEEGVTPDGNDRETL